MNLNTDRDQANHAVVVSDNHEKYVAAYKKLNGSIYHHPGWSEVLSAYSLRTYWLVAEQGDNIIGLLPLVRQSSFLFGQRLISYPWVDETGVTGDVAAKQALLARAAEMTIELGSGWTVMIKPSLALEFDTTPQSYLVDKWGTAAGDKVLMRRHLSMSSQLLWKELSAKVRNQVRKAEKNGLQTMRGGTEMLADFFDVYSRNMRDLGSPSHSKRFFQKLLEALGDRAAIYCTQLDGKTVGAGIVLDNRPSLDIPWASSLREYNRLCVNHALYWRILSDACDEGYQWFHFGRSTIGSGQHRFKKQWGAEEKPLAWLCYPARQEEARDGRNTATLRSKFSIAEKLWRKLPLWMSTRLGPRIIRHVP